LSVCEVLLQSARLQVCPEETIDVSIVKARFTPASLILVDQSIAFQLHSAVLLPPDAFFNLLEKCPGLKVGQFKHHTPDNLRLRSHFESVSSKNTYRFLSLSKDVQDVGR
jgi:hypothetical protein